MKTIIILILLLSINITVFSQNNQTIDSQLTKKTWVDLESRNIHGYTVTRIDGTDYGNSRNSSFGMITSVAYNNSSDNGNAQLEFYITRYEQSQANLKWYMIIIRGEDDKTKIFKKKLDYQSAELPEGNYYWNYTTIDLPNNIHPPFYVYIRDRNIQLLYSTKFKIEK